MRKVFILNGLPGSGKGTQANLLAEKLNLMHISSGQLIRDFVSFNTSDPLALEIRERIEKGIPQSDEIANNLVSRKISASKAKQGIIFDSYPINLKQARYLSGIAEKYELKDPVFIHLKVDSESVIKRLTTRKICSECGQPYTSKAVYGKPEIQDQLSESCAKCGGELIVRSDDREEIVRARIKNYLPLLDEMVNFYQKRNSVIEINGDQSIKKVADDIIQATNH